MGGKWRHKMDLKFSIFIFVHLFCSDERRPLTNIKPKKLLKYHISNKIYNFLQCQNLLLKQNFCKFHCIISPDWIKNFSSVLSLFQDHLSATDMQSLTIYILKFHFKSMTSISRQEIQTTKKYKTIETFTIKISFTLPNLKWIR